MRLTFLWIGKTRDPLFAELETRYLERIRYFLPARVAVVPDQAKRNSRQARAAEEKQAKTLQSRLPKRGTLVALGEQGKVFDSIEFSRFLDELMNRSTTDVTFLAGGHQGIPGKITRQADTEMSLSRLTLPHEMARVVLVEQVYRGLTLARGLPYHK